MHEFNLVKKEVEKVLEKSDNKPITRIVFKLGKMAHGTPVTIREAFKVATLDSPLASAELEVISVEPRIKCNDCGNVFGCSDDVSWVCPSCGSSLNELISGKECFIDNIEVED